MKFFAKYKLFILPLVALMFLVGAFLKRNSEINEQNYKINKTYIETLLHKEEINLEKITLRIKKQVAALKPNSLTKSWAFNKIKNNFNNNYTILIYKSDTLQYWSNNVAPIPDFSVLKNAQSNSVIKLSNGWYEIIKQNIKNISIIGLLKIKNNYYYDNEYLKSNFIISHKIPASVILSTTPMIIGTDIHNNKGDYIFSLIPPINNDETSTNKPVSFIIFFISIILFLLFFSKFFNSISNKKYSYLVSFLITVSLGVLFYFMLEKLNSYFSFSNFRLYNEKIKVHFLFSSFENILILSSYIVFVAVNFFVIFPIEEFAETKIKTNKIYTSIFIGSFTLIIFIYFLYLTKLISWFSNKSNALIDIHDMLNVNISTLPTYIFYCLLFFSVIYLLDLFVRLSSRITDLKTSLSISLTIGFATFLYFIFIGLPHNYISILFYYLLLIIIILVRYLKFDYSNYTLVLIIFVFTVFFVIFENKNFQEKEYETQNKIINNLANEHDQMAERFLQEINYRLLNDTILQNKIIDVSYEQNTKIISYLLKKYFYGFWEKYDLSISLCGNTEFYGSENQAANCKGYYSNMFNEFGQKVENTVFWFINDNSGKITYTGLIDVPLKKDSRNLQLYISLYEKLVSKQLGFPKLLIDKSSLNNNKYPNYSYAKYKNGILAVKFGDYTYDFTDKDFSLQKHKNKHYIKKNGYKHLIYEDSVGQKIVLSKKEESFFDLVISFAYLFIFFNVLVFVSIVIINYKFAFKKFKFDFTNQIRFAMLFILVLSFFVFGAGTIYFTIKQDKKVTTKEIADKVQSVLVELKHKLENEEILTASWHTDKYGHLDELLMKFSKVFFSDINLYDLDGYLLATSRSEIFNKGLIGKQMNPLAYKMMSIVKKTEFINNERIGNLEFLSIYIPLENQNNKIIAYINLPYFTKNDDLQNSISNVFITTINLYLVLFLLTIFIAFIISTEISRPLRMLQDKFKTVQLGQKHHEIIYNKNDEIGELVKEYNLMVSKLEHSAKKLAESERESAWREMAKQIAHEIKNPLTPMKLSIQFLQKSWHDKIESEKDFENRLNSVSETLIEQINTLSAIASEFSAFAKMPKTRKEEVDIVKKLQTVTHLFENSKNIEILFNSNNIKELIIIADNEQISRVFINLIKNAIQAIPEERFGRIKISLKETQTKAIITVEDNGNGIPDDKKERLFEPSFTTKTTGMGIGLAIVKNIINSVGGDIWFESELTKGTRFFVEFLKI